jgi:CRISPR-associated protein Csb2
MPFSITAEPLLGTYRGHGPDGRTEAIPSVARLHSALLCAAGLGPRAEQREGGLAPSGADEVALRWLEDNPPDAVGIPAIRVNRPGATAYRDDGTLKKARATATVKKFPKDADSSVAVGGPFTWTWSETPPPEVAEVLEAMCPEVAHLGTAETPVRLTGRRLAAAATHTLDADAGLFTGAGEDVELPAPGRVAELVSAHAQARAHTPTIHRDAPKVDESSASPAPPRIALRTAKYIPLHAATRDVPWPEVIVLPLDRRVPERHKVRWAVAAHRALIHAVGDGAPPLLTGAYPPGSPRPANRVALHFLDDTAPVEIPQAAPGALLVMLPAGAPESDLAVLLGALRNLTSIRGPGGRRIRAEPGAAERRPGGLFWADPGPGMLRLWRSSPPAVPDTRGHRVEWTFGHAVLLSLGFVWQGSAALPRVAGRGEARDRALVTAACDAGAAVLDAEALRTSEVGYYAHRVHQDAVVRPYRATIHTGGLGGARALQALGQSRHLAGGLLYPYDLPEGTTLEAPIRSIDGA